jgi:hypothetical protein
MFWKLDFPFGPDLYGSSSFEGLRQEVKNVADEPQCADIVKSLREQVEAWQ